MVAAYMVFSGASKTLAESMKNTFITILMSIALILSYYNLYNKPGF